MEGDLYVEHPRHEAETRNQEGHSLDVTTVTELELFVVFDSMATRTFETLQEILLNGYGTRPRESRVARGEPRDND